MLTYRAGVAGKPAVARAMAEHLMEICQLHLSEPPRPPRLVAPGIDPEIEAVILQALAVGTGAAVAGVCGVGALRQAHPEIVTVLVLLVGASAAGTALLFWPPVVRRILRVAAPEEGAGTTRPKWIASRDSAPGNGTASGVLRSAHRRGIRRSSGEVPRFEGLCHLRGVRRRNEASISPQAFRLRFSWRCLSACGAPRGCPRLQ